MESQLMVFVLPLFCICSSIASSEVYHITVSPSDPCPVTSCLTLSQLAANCSNYLRYSNTVTTLIFQPGSHILTQVLLVANIGKVLLHSYNSDSFSSLSVKICLLYTSPSPRDATLSRMPSSA